MTTRLTGYQGLTIQADDTYILAMIDPQERPVRAAVSIVRNSAYDGSIAVMARPAGSSAPFLAFWYLTKAGVVATAALSAGNDQIVIDAAGQEIAFVTSGRTVGNASINVSPAVEA